MQRARRANPYPMTWEIPLAVVVGVVMTLILGLHLARALANAVAGNGWRFTPQDELFTALPGLLAGDAAAGLTHLVHPAGPVALHVWMTVVELLAVIVMAIAVKYGLGRWGPGRIQGMASRGEAEQLLGVARLRKVAPVVRPDLYGGTGRGGRR